MIGGMDQGQWIFCNYVSHFNVSIIRVCKISLPSTCTIAQFFIRPRLNKIEFQNSLNGFIAVRLACVTFQRCFHTKFIEVVP